jgi:C4-dicarboxylate transporter, DctM subunit
LPIINAFSYNPIWFGIYIVLLVQIANITPPVGFNLFLVNGISRYSIGQISRWVLPFLSIMILFVIFIMLFPDFVSFLPNMVFQ